MYLGTCAGCSLSTSIAIRFNLPFYTPLCSQQQGLVSNVHLWQGNNSTLNSNQVSEGALMVRNTGYRIIGVDSIKVRGRSKQFSDWYVSDAVDSTHSLPKALKYLSNPPERMQLQIPQNL